MYYIHTILIILYVNLKISNKKKLKLNMIDYDIVNEVIIDRVILAELLFGKIIRDSYLQLFYKCNLYHYIISTFLHIFCLLCTIYIIVILYVNVKICNKKK